MEEIRCYCGEPYFVFAIVFEEPRFERVGDRVEIKRCQGCGRDLQTVDEERTDQWMAAYEY